MRRRHIFIIIILAPYPKMSEWCFFTQSHHPTYQFSSVSNSALRRLMVSSSLLLPLFFISPSGWARLSEISWLSTIVIDWLEDSSVRPYYSSIWGKVKVGEKLSMPVWFTAEDVFVIPTLMTNVSSAALIVFLSLDFSRRHSCLTQPCSTRVLVRSCWILSWWLWLMHDTHGFSTSASRWSRTVKFSSLL